MIKKIKAFLFKLKLKRKGISMADLRLTVLNQKLLEYLSRECDYEANNSNYI